MFVLTLILTFVTSLAIADGTETQKNNKRPSWSKGLPERKDSPNLFIPSTKNLQQDKKSEQFFEPSEQVNEIKVDFDIEPTDVISSNPPTSKQVFTGDVQNTDSHSQTSANSLKALDIQQNHETVPQATQPVFQKPLPEQKIASQYPPTNSSDQESLKLTSASSSNKYNWQIDRQTRVEVPLMFLSTQSSVLVKIFINNEGQVIGIEPVTSNTSSSLINHVRRSVNRWRFAPPQAQGNSASILSRVFKVELSAKT